MDWNGLLLGIGGLIFGGGCTWIFTVKSIQRKADGEAVQTEAEGWKSQQDVYQQTINDLKESCEYIREDRNLLREEAKNLRIENAKLREKIQSFEDDIVELKKDYAHQIAELRKEQARIGRKIEALQPFTCGVAGCMNRSKVDLKDNEEYEDENIK